jgi:16S rRNA (adenine1518-N6/adenine1519-N6)-dimethyltransferase
VNVQAARRIVERFAPKPGSRVIEIGPGRGALTTLLMESGASVIAVEVDPGLADELRERFAGLPPFTLIEADILRCDIAALAGGEPSRVLANLPYSITGPVLMRLFAACGSLTDMTLMLQREVANRIVASPGGRVYGSLSVVAQYFTDPRAIMDLAPGSFSPPPAVSSTVLEMPCRARRELTAGDEKLYPAFVRLLFGRRRRTLLNNLKGAGHFPAAILERLPGLADPAAGLGRAGLDPLRRPETLARGECLELFRALASG